VRGVRAMLAAAVAIGLIQGTHVVLGIGVFWSGQIEELFCRLLSR
jgi:hypothetical protein